MSQSKYSYMEFSGSIQQKTTTHIKKPNEVRSASNADFWTVLGAVSRRPGAQGDAASLPKLPYNIPPLGAYVAHFPTATEVWAAQNNTDSGATAGILKYWTGPGATDWTNIYTNLLKDSQVHMIEDLDEIWVTHYDPVTDTLGTSFTVDSSHSTSTTRQLAYGPSARFFVEFAGCIWAADVLIGANRYRDRLYKSSGPTGAVTFIRSPQTDPAADFDLIDQVPVMTAASTPAGTVTASTENGTNSGWKAFDGGFTTSSRWLANATTGTLQYDFGSGNTKVLTHYTIIGVPTDESGETDRAPKTWTFEGSNNGSSWTTLNTQTNVAAWTAGEKRTYATSNTTAYRYYRLNITANQGDGSYVGIAEAEFMSSTVNVDTLEVEIDSARYIKPGLTIDIYAAGTDTLLYTITPTAVDKINDTFSFIPTYQSFAPADVNTSTEVITLPSAAEFTTGKPIVFSSSGTLPTGLAAGTTYYAIYVSSTTIKVATSALNASIGSAVDISATGSGVHRVRSSYVFGNKDEIWKSGRKGKLTRFWNTDYRNPEASDYIKLPATLDSVSAITGVGAISNRLFPMTETAMFKFDGQNIIPLRNDVGCVAHRSIAYYDSFMVWLDAKGNIWVRNEEGGSQDIISSAIEETMALVPDTQLPDASAVCVDDKYKLYLGQVDGRTLRVVYSFRTNQWSVEWWTPKMPVQFEHIYDGDAHPHFFDAVGQMWVDEEGTDDNGNAIAFEVEPGDDPLGADEVKKFIGAKIYTKNAVGTKLFAQVDGSDWYELGQIQRQVDTISLATLPKGTLLNFRLSSSLKGDTPRIEKATIWFNKEEDTFRVVKQ